MTSDRKPENSAVRNPANDNLPGAARQRRGAVLPFPSRRGLAREHAAAYVGISPSLFDVTVHDGRMPQPKKINGRRIWDVVALDTAFDALPGGEFGSVGCEANPWDEKTE